MAYQVNFCETKEQLKHLAEVVTGKADGSPTGADIDTSTLAYAGLVRDTLPELLSKLGWYSVGEWSTDPLISKDNQYVLYNGIRYVPLSIPYQVDSTANPDPELLVGSDLKVITDVTNEDITEAQNDIVGGSIFKGSNGEYVQNGDTVPAGTTHLRVLVDGKPSIVAISKPASGTVTSLTESGAMIGSEQVFFPEVFPFAVVFKNNIHGSAIENMLEGNVNGFLRIKHVIGNRYNTGGTEWVVKSISNPMTLNNFTAKSMVASGDFKSSLLPNDGAQYYLDYLSLSRAKGYMTSSFTISEPLYFRSNITIDATGANFGSPFNITGNGQIRFDGNYDNIELCQHCSLSDLHITVLDTTQDNIVYMDECYSIYQDNIRIFDLPAGKTGIQFKGGGDCRISKPTIRPKNGESPSASIEVDCEGGVDGVDAQLQIDNPDLEGAIDNLVVTSGYCDVNGWYGERAKSLDAKIQPDGNLMLRGGKLLHSGGAALQVKNFGGGLKVFGTNYEDSTDGNREKAFFLFGDASRSEFYGIDRSLIDVDVNCRGLPTVYGLFNGGVDNRHINKISMGNGDIHQAIQIGMVSAGTPSLRIDVRVWANSSGFSRIFRDYSFLVSRAGGAMVSSPLIEGGSSKEATSNYNVDVVGSLDITSSNCTLNLTCSLTGAIDSSGLVDVFYEVTTVGANNQAYIRI